MSNYSSTSGNDSNGQWTKLDASIIRSSSDKFQMLPSDNSASKNASCLVFSRSTSDKTENSTVKTIRSYDCSKPQHTICTTKPIAGRLLQKRCLEKPLTLGLPAMISNHLTPGLCRFVCGQLQTTSAIVQINKCYCVNSALAWIIESILKDSTDRQQDCGKPCPGTFLLSFTYDEIILIRSKSTI